MISRYSPTIKSDFRPKITVFIPMRDESSNVERKLEEIISMDYPNENLSLLVVDTGSIDGTKEIATKFLESKKPNFPWKVHYLDQPGKSSAVNFALKSIKTEFFVMTDADSHCRKDSLSLLMDNMSNPEIGAVCGSFHVIDEGLEFQYRKRFNALRIAESIRNSTPIFEGSICAFRIESLGGQLIDEDVNADDSQLAMLSIKNGFKSIMDGRVQFTEPNSPMGRRRRVRRAQGLSRVLFRNRKLAFGRSPISGIMRQNLYFYLVFPWLLFLCSFLMISIAAHQYLLQSEDYRIPIEVVSFSVFFLIAVASRTGRSLFLGTVSLIEAHLRILVGNSLNVWETDRK